MLKLINLFFIGIFIISCGGEVGSVYHNGMNSSGNTNGSGNSNGSGSSNGSSVTPKPTTPAVTCLPGADCNIKQPSTNTQTSGNCLPGVECSPTVIKVDTGTKPGTKTTSPDTNSSSKKKGGGCLPGVVDC